MSIELGLAIVGTVDLCLKYGNELRKICSALRGAEAELEERALRLENGWARCIAQLDFLNTVQEGMNESHRDLHERTLRMLSGKLGLATSILRGLVTTQYIENGSEEPEVRITPKKVEYAFKKEKLDEAIEALETWQRISDPSWFLILRMNDNTVDSLSERRGTGTISQSIPSVSSVRSTVSSSTGPINSGQGLSLPAGELTTMRVNNILFCGSKYASGCRGTTYILDVIQTPSSDMYQTTKKNMRDLARRLQHDEPENFGLLRCKGFVAEMGDPTANIKDNFMMVLRVPSEMSNPRSLRDHLINSPTPSTLSQRFLMAQQVAKSVSYVHVFGFVHKNIRPETILTFEPKSSQDEQPQNALPSVLLIGFEEFRKDEGQTRKVGDNALERNLYRHPSRQGANPSNYYCMQHDIYSLGICLLEIGLWHSFVEYNPDQSENNATFSSLLQERRNASRSDTSHYLFNFAKNRLLKLARAELRQCMGTQYSEIVETCLTCLDPSGNTFGDEQEFEDEDGIQVGVRYIEKVLLRLNYLNV